jgi:hypothetical protein
MAARRSNVLITDTHNKMFTSTQIRVLESHPVTPPAKPQPNHIPSISNPQGTATSSSICGEGQQQPSFWTGGQVLDSLGQESVHSENIYARERIEANATMTSGPLCLFQVTTICELITNDNSPTTIKLRSKVCHSFSYYYYFSLTFVLEPDCAAEPCKLKVRLSTGA